MKQIFVQAQADHIESLYRGTPIAAIEELVWNALDAEAREVKVDLITNAIGGIDAIRVSDDGTGIDILKADQTFGNLGGSWKRADGAGKDSHRRLHGRHGRGRFKAFALGSHVEWRTTMRAGRDMLSYVLSGDADKPGVFELDSTSMGPGTGTEVFITNVRAVCNTLFNAEETVQSLAAKFALYLKSYPDVRIYFNGIPVTPIIVQKRVTNYTVTIEGGAEAKLEIIEWKRKFVGSGKLVFAGADGFQLHEQAAGVRAENGESFTAYLVSPRFTQLHAENALIMDELNPETRQYIDATKKVLKSHFAAFADKDKTPFELEWEPRIERLTKDECKALIGLLKKWVR